MQAGEAIAVIILIVAVLILIYYFLINNPNISSKIKSYVPATADPHMDQILHRDGTSDYKELSTVEDEIEKDLESKRLMDTPIPLPKEQQESLSAIRKSTTQVRSEVGFLHSEINERLARLEAQTEQRKLEKMLKEIEAKEEKLRRSK